jgi:hypothetical protein
MMEKDEKATLDAQAQAANVSTAEFVRRQLFGRTEPPERAFLQMLAELKPLVRRACKAIDANLAEIGALRRGAAEEDRRAAAQVRQELSRGTGARSVRSARWAAGGLAHLPRTARGWCHRAVTGH